jgi:hypothetical protein
MALPSAATPSASASSLRRWADYSDDEDEELFPRSYCEVLQSGSPPSPPLAAAAPPSPVVVGSAAARPWSSALRVLAAEARAGASSPRVDAPVGGASPRVEALVGGVEVPGGEVGPWMHAGGRKRHRGLRAGARAGAGVELPALAIQDGLPPDLAGKCFNCLRECHISKVCTFETVCLRCLEEGHHAKACPLRRAPTGAERQRRLQMLLAQRVAAPEAPVPRWRAPPMESRRLEPRGAPEALPERRGGVHARLGIIDGPSSPVDVPVPGASRIGLYRVPAKRRLGERMPSPAPSPQFPPSLVAFGPSGR